MTIETNLNNIRQSIEETCLKNKIAPSDVKLIAVSKRKPTKMILDAHKSGHIDFGENNVQEAKTKYEEISAAGINDIKWHIIGHLQTNKVKYITKFCHLLHSLDRESLADALQKRLEHDETTMNCLIQVNTSKEDSKSGISTEEAIEFAKYVSQKDRIFVKGLMTIAENSEDEEAIRSNFRELKNLSQQISELNLPNFDMKELSMGMSKDYQIAIAEGATLIRVGSAIFGERDNNKASEIDNKKDKNQKNIESTEPKAESRFQKIARQTDEFILKYTPNSVINFFDKLTSKLPNRLESWVRSNRFLTICIAFTIRGLFFRPSMWLLYASIAAYFGYK